MAKNTEESRYKLYTPTHTPQVIFRQGDERKRQEQRLTGIQIKKSKSIRSYSFHIVILIKQKDYF